MKTSILPLLTILSCINRGGGVRNLAYDDDDVGDANGYWEYQWGGDYAGDNDGVDGNVVYADDEDASYDDDIYSYFFDAYGGMDGSDDDGGAGAMIYNDDDLFSLFFGQDESSRSNRRHQRRRKRIRLLALMVMVLSGVIAMLCCCCCWLFRQRCQKTFGLEGPKDNTYVHMKEGVIV